MNLTTERELHVPPQGTTRNGTSTDRSGAVYEAFFIVAVIGVGFQFFHFAEHLAQLVFWVRNPQAPAWLSTWAMSGSDSLSGLGDGSRPMGVEFLHLIGNMIFLSGLVALGMFMRHSTRGSGRMRWLRNAAVIQTIHVIEHVALTASLAVGGEAVGVSTLFGALSGSALVAFRVWFHFLINFAGTAATLAYLASVYVERKKPTDVSPTRGAVASGHQSAGAADAATLLAGAAAGDEQAFDGLFRRYGPEAWRYASGVAGNDATARYAVTDGFATTVAAARDGMITHPGGFRRSLLHAARLRVAERDDPAMPGQERSSEPIAPAFASLPELLRSVLWLEHVHHLRPSRIADVTDVPSAEVVDLARRAHDGVAVLHLDTQAAIADDPCAHALRGSARGLAGPLPFRDRAAVRSHVASCDSCRADIALVNDLDSALPRLAAVLPENLVDESRAAWIIAITPPSPTGLSPAVEKVVAAASATAAVVAVVGAAYWRGRPPGDAVALSPVLHHVGSPPAALEPIDFDALGVDSQFDLPYDTGVSDTGDLASPAPPVASDPSGTPSGSGASSAAPHATPGPAGSSPTASPSVGSSMGRHSDAGVTPAEAPGDTATLAPPEEPDGAIAPPTEAAPLLAVSLPLGNQTAVVDVGGDDGLNVESTDGSGDAAVEPGGDLDALDPVVEPVNDALTNLGGWLGR